MTSDKIEDIVARLLLRGDIQRVASKPKLNESQAAEKALHNARDIAITVGGVDVVLQSLGQMFVRVGLMLTGKEKQGRERKVYVLKEICDMYLDDVSKTIGCKVVLFRMEWSCG